MSLLPGSFSNERDTPPFALILLIATAAFCLSLSNNFVWDDWILLVPNQTYITFDIKGIFLGLDNAVEYLPVRDLSLAIDTAIWGTNPFGFHLTNLLLYLVTLYVLYILVTKIAELFEIAGGNTLAFWSTLIFAVHPLHAEVINFVTGGRNTLLAGLFLFISWALLMIAFQRNSKTLIFVSIFFYLLALFSKAITVFFPAFLICLLWIVPLKVVTLRRKILVLVSYSLVTAAAILVHINYATNSGIVAERLFVFGSEATGYAVGKSFQIIWFYIKMLLVPFPLSVDYATPVAIQGFWAMAALASLPVLTLIFVALKIRNISPMAFCGITWFLSSLIPVLNFFPTIPVVADRYTYLGIFGFGLLCADLLCRFKQHQKPLASIALVIIMAWSCLSFARTLDWRTDITLWQSATRANPSASRINLAQALWDQGRYEEAFSELSIEKEQHSAEAYNYDFYKGLLLTQQGLTDDAIQAFKLSLAEGGDAYRKVHFNLAKSYEIKGETQLALKHYLETIESNAVDPFGKYRQQAQAGIERIWQQFAPRAKVLRQEAEGNRQDPVKQHNYAYFLHLIGKYDEAAIYYQRITKLAPSRWEAWYNLGLAQQKQRQYNNAIEAFKNTAALNSSNADIFNSMGNCYFELKLYSEAEKNYLTALQIKPDYFFPTFNLARVYFYTNNKENALKYFEKASNLAGKNDAYRSRIKTYLQLMVE